MGYQGVRAFEDEDLEAFGAALDEYLTECAERTVKHVAAGGVVIDLPKPRLPSRAGFAVHVGVTERTLDNYGKRPGFSDALDRLTTAQKAFLHDSVLEYTSVRGSMFLLNVAHRMVETTKTENELTVTGTLSSTIQTARRRAQEGEE